jgi:large repetitive protein
MSLKSFRRPVGGLVLALLLWAGASASKLEAQTPAVVLQDVPADVLIGEVFHFKLLFKADPTVTGFGPFVELAVQYRGADCTAPPGPCDGLELVSASALFANGSVPLNACTAVAPDTSCSPNPAQCPWTSATPAPAGCFFGLPPAPAGFQKSVFLLPFGSFVPGQPDVEIDVAVRVHAFADVNFPLQILARGGFRYGGSALGTSPSTAGAAVSATVTPHVLRVHKRYLGPEDETATGPNFPRQYQVEVDVANGQTLQNVEIEDCFPANVTYLSVAGASPSPIGAPIVSGNCVTVPFGTLTGGSGTQDALATFNFFVPALDASNQQVLGPSCSATSLDQATASGDWTPTDPRDSFTTDSVTATHTLVDKCLALQKTAALAVDTGAPGPTPGDIVQYTLDFQVSDFRTLRNLVVDDYLSDGQTLLTATPPSLLIRDRFGGPFSGSFVPGLTFTQAVVPSTPCQVADPTVQPQRIRFQVSGLLALLDPFQPRHLLGMLTGGHASLPVAGVPATGRIVFQARIDDQYQRQPATLEPFVDKDDPLLNCATATAQVLSNVNAPALPTSVTGNAADSSALEFRIVVGQLNKSVFAINGNTSVPPLPKVSPGDLITFRIQYPIPSTDAEALKVVDYSPLPALPVSSAFTLSPSCGLSIPPVNQAASIGSLCSFGVTPSFLASGPAAPNSLTFNYGDFNDPANAPRPVDIRYTVRVSPAPFVDGLQLTNEAYETETNTFGRTSAQAAIAQVTLCEPKLRVRKGVVRTNKAGALFSPLPPAPAGVTFAPPGASGPAFTGTITSGNIGNALNSDLSAVDGCDLVKYAIVVENLGCSAKGAFDVRINDLIPACLGSRFNLQVRKGNGAPFTCNGGKNCATLLGSFFGTAGITLDDAPTAGSLGPFSSTGGNNIAVITFDAQIGCKVPATGCCSNVAKLLSYAGVEGGPNHVNAGFSTPFPGASSPFSEDAKVCVQPKLAKSIVTTSEPHTSGTTLTIGETVTYKLEVVVPEGTSPGMTVIDILPAGLQWLPGSCSVVKSPPITTTGSLNNVVLNGPILTLNLGNVANNANNAVAETLSITCKALVQNLPVNVKAAVKLNSFSVKIQGVSFPSNGVQSVIVEPMGNVTKQELPSPVPGSTVYVLSYTNNGTAAAFDINLLDNLPSPLTVSGPVQVNGASCTLAATPPTQVKATCAMVPAGATVKVQFTAKGVPNCKALVNAVRLDYTSLPGLRGTGNAAPGASGATNGERVYTSTANVTTSRCPDLVLTKTHSGNFLAGQNGTYTITVKNTGSLPSAPPDTVQDTLPAGFAFVSGGGNGWTCTANGQLVTCTSGTPVPPGGSSTFTTTVTVPCGPPLVENCVQVTTTSEANLSNNRTCDPTKIDFTTKCCVKTVVVSGIHYPSKTCAQSSDEFQAGLLTSFFFTSKCSQDAPLKAVFDISCQDAPIPGFPTGSVHQGTACCGK